MKNLAAILNAAGMNLGQSGEDHHLYYRYKKIREVNEVCNSYFAGDCRQETVRFPRCLSVVNVEISMIAVR